VPNTLILVLDTKRATTVQLQLSYDQPLHLELAPSGTRIHVLDRDDPLITKHNITKYLTPDPGTATLILSTPEGTNAGVLHLTDTNELGNPLTLSEARSKIVSLLANTPGTP